MGVKGLCLLLEGNSQIYQDIPFRDRKLVVDGINLAHILYNRANLDQNHGGEYLAFQAEVQAFFKALENCQIKAKVVIDGGSGPSDIKLMSLGPEDGPSKNTCQEDPWRSEGCFGEADGQLAALARELSCPVLSGDTDFYIYNLPEGVLPLDQFQWDSVKPNGARSYISCKRYTMSSFCTLFNIDHQLLPLFAALAGNDYDNLRDVKWDRYVPAGRPTMKFRVARLVGLLSWLGARTDRTTEDTLTAAMALITNISQQARTEMRTEVQNAMLEYRLPELVRPSLARRDLGSDILDHDILTHRRKFLRIQVEYSILQSSNLTSRPIRQVMYGLLLGPGGGEVEEWDRDGLDLVGVKVQPLVQGAAQTLRLDSPPQAAPETVRLQVCLETLGVEEETLEGVPAHLRLPVAVTCYWLRRASPEPTLLKALLMVMVQGELNRRTGGTTGWQGDTNHISEPLDSVVAHSFNQWQACLKDASQLNLLLCKPLPEPHYAWLYQGRLVHRWQKQLQEREPEDIVQDDQFRRLYGRLLGAVTQTDPGANRRAGGPEGQLRASMEHLHLNTQDEEEEEEEEEEVEEELGGAAGLDQGSGGPWVEVKRRRRKQ
ncbi:unnamed protein product [Arctogadus glacialis]